MADKKITALTESTSLSTDDLFHVVDSPGSSPSNKKITVTNIFNKVPTYLAVNSVDSITTTGTQAVPLTTAVTLLNVTGASVLGTVGAGSATGQIKTVAVQQFTSTTRLSFTGGGTTLGAWTFVNFAAAGDAATFMWTGTPGWIMVGNFSGAVTAADGGTGIATATS